MLGGLTFTPVLDILITKYKDVYPALIFGKIYRYQQCKNGYCSASYKTIGDSLSISKSTVARHISKLVKDFFILDISPEKYNIDGTTRRYVVNQNLLDTIVRKTTLLKENDGTVVTKSVEENILYIINTSIKEYILTINNIISYEVSLTTVDNEIISSEGKIENAEGQEILFNLETDEKEMPKQNEKDFSLNRNFDSKIFKSIPDDPKLKRANDYIKEIEKLKEKMGERIFEFQNDCHAHDYGYCTNGYYEEKDIGVLKNVLKFYKNYQFKSDLK